MANREDLEKQDNLHAQRVVYEVEDMHEVRVRKDLLYKTVEETDLHLDIYYPAHMHKNTSLPAVLLIHGDGPPAYLKGIKDSGQYVSWGELIAASGLIAVNFNHRSTEGLTNVAGVMNDIDDLITYVRENSHSLRIEAENLAIWMCSAGGFLGLHAALNEAPPYVRAIVCYYALTELQAYYKGLYGDVDAATQAFIPTFTEEDFAEFSSLDLLRRRPSDLAPMFIARAGLDNPGLNEVLDSFISEAIAQNTTLQFMNHPTGRHGFDIRDDDPRSSEIIQATLTFLQTHLLPLENF
jgi:acetyl esterase/lipase